MSTSTTATQSSPWPLFDLFLDVPHPLASAQALPATWIPSPTLDSALHEELSRSLPHMARFAFPEVDPSTEPPPQSDNNNNQQPALNVYDKYAMQAKSFQQFTFSLQLSTGQRLHGHVRRYLPTHPQVGIRYDVGRRSERALILLTRASGADGLYAALLKYVYYIFHLHFYCIRTMLVLSPHSL
jgi:hypothetical protein